MGTLNKSHLYLGVISKLKLTLGTFILAALHLVAGNNIDFIENKGQWPEQVLYKAQLAGQNIYLEKDRILYQVYELEHFHNHGEDHDHEHAQVKGHTYEVELINANLIQSTTTGPAANYYFNYYHSRHQDQWVSHTSAFNDVTLKEVYNRIDMRYYQQNGNIKYDFIVQPGADINQIQLKYNGVKRPKIKHKNLIIETSVGDVIEHAPIVYQNQGGKRTYIDCKYKLKKDVLSFEIIGDYDIEETIIIDPTLIFSTYSGSTANNFGFTATYDDDGFLYAGSTAFDQGYPTTLGAYQTTFAEGVIDMAISKYDTSGAELIYSTYIGGSNGEMPQSMIVDNNGDLVILGSTGSSDYPTSTTAYDTSFNGGNWAGLNSSSYFEFFENAFDGFGTDIVITKLGWEGELKVSTFLGGSGNDGLSNSTDLILNYADDFRGSISINEDNDIIIGTCTGSVDIPTTSNAIQTAYGGSQDGYIAKLTSGLDSLMYSTYIGGQNADAVYSVMIRDSFLLFGGSTLSNDIDYIAANFPDTASFLTSQATGIAGVINMDTYDTSKVIRFGSGGNADQIYFVDFDSDNAFYIMGQTESSDEDFFIHNVGYSKSNSGQFITKFNEAMDSIEWSTMWGNESGNPNISPTAFMVDYCKRIYVSGWGTTWMAGDQFSHPRSNTSNMDVTDDAYQTSTDNGDFYLMVLAEDADTLLYGSYFGGGFSQEHVDGGTSRFDKRGIIYQSVCAGCGGFSDFPIEPSNAYSAINRANCNNGVFKLSFDQELLVADFDLIESNCPGKAFTFNNKSTFLDSAEVLWNFGDGDTSTAVNPSHLYDEPGEYRVTLRVTNLSICNAVDRTAKILAFDTVSTYTLDSIIQCGQNITVGPEVDLDASYQWTPNTGLSSTTIANPTVNTDRPTLYTIYEYQGVCVDTFYQYVELDTMTSIEPTFTNETIDCKNQIVQFTNTSDTTNTSLIWNFYGDTSHAQEVTYNFDSAGLQAVQLILNYEHLCSITATIDTSIFLLENASTRIDSIVTCLSSTSMGIKEYEYPMTYTWNDATHLNNANHPNPITTIQFPFNFELYITDGTCTDTILQHVNIEGLSDELELVASEDTVDQYETVLIKLNLFYDFDDTLIWNNYDITEVPQGVLGFTSNSLEETTTFSAIAILAEDSNCTLPLSKTVYIRPYTCDQDSIFVPNGFTPNNDGLNDVVNVAHPSFTIRTFDVFDRYGNKVYEIPEEGSHHLFPWDGIYKDMKLEPGAYVYYLEGDCNGAFSKQGNITLIR